MLSSLKQFPNPMSLSKKRGELLLLLLLPLRIVALLEGGVFVPCAAANGDAAREAARSTYVTNAHSHRKVTQ